MAGVDRGLPLFPLFDGAIHATLHLHSCGSKESSLPIHHKMTTSACPLGLGTSRFATPFDRISYKHAELLIDTAKELGITTIDTADSYGSGEAERMIGRILQNRKSHFRIATKAGYVYGNFPPPFQFINSCIKQGSRLAGFRRNFSVTRIAKCLDASRSRLGTDIEYFLLHDPPLPVLQNGEIIAFLKSAELEGKIRIGGVSTSKFSVMKESLDKGIKYVQAPMTLLLGEHASAIRSIILTNQVYLVVNHVFLGGHIFNAPNLEQNPILKIFIQLAQEAGVNTNDFILQFLNALPHVSLILSGTRNADHLRDNVKLLSGSLDSKVLNKAFCAFGLPVK